MPLLVYRFVAGLGATTNLSQTAPWGIWIGFDMMTGIVLAAGGFTIGATVQLFGLKEYHPIERPAILTAFLGYVMAVVGLSPTSAARGTSCMVFVQLRHRLGAVRGRLVRHVLHDACSSSSSRVPDVRVARLEEAPRGA